MEIERKYLVKTLPDHLDQYESKKIAQGYLCTDRRQSAPRNFRFSEHFSLCL